MIDISESRPKTQPPADEAEPIAYKRELYEEEGQEEDEVAEERFFLRRFNWRKLSISSYILLGCIVLMFLCVVLSLAAPEHALLSEAFDAFKMIALVVLGYIFGTNSNNTHHHD